MGKRMLHAVVREFSDDFTVINGSLLLCKFCEEVIDWRKKSKIHEHLKTKMHQDRKEAKLSQWLAAARRSVISNSEGWHSPENEGDPAGEGSYDELDRRSSQYCLRWNQHTNNMLKVFSRLLEDEQLTDVLIACEGRSVRAHKVVLSACSPYFESLFMEFNEKNQIVILRDTPFADISAIIDFMYKGEVNVSQSQLPSLLRTANYLRVSGLGENAVTDPPAIISPSHPSVSVLHDPLRLSPLPQSQFAVPRKTPEPANGDPPRRKRGRPSLLDSASDVESFMPSSETNLPSRTQVLPSVSKLDVPSSSHRASNDAPDPIWMSESPPFATMRDEPTPGGPLTEERIKTLGIVKMNDYIKTGSRQQFWEEYYVRVVMQAVRNKEIDMKGGAELLGVSYGTLYGRYRELFGYVKHAWNVGGRPSKIPTFTTTSFLTDPSNNHFLDQLKEGKISIRQAARSLGMDTRTLAFHLGQLADDTGTPSFKLARFADEMDGDDDSLDFRFNGEMGESDDEVDARDKREGNNTGEAVEKKVFSVRKSSSKE